MKIDREKMNQIGEAVKTREEMRQSIRATYSNDALAQRFGVTWSCIQRVILRETWVDVVQEC